MSNLPAQLSTLQREIYALTEKLALAGDDEINQFLDGLMDAGIIMPESVRAADPSEEYRIALRNIPIFGVRRVYAKLKRGEYQNINLDFIPLPAKLAAMANAECQTIRESRVRACEYLQALLDARSTNAGRVTSRDPAAVARVKARREAFLRGHAAEKAREVNPVSHAAISAGGAEMPAKIMALADADSSVGQMACGRKSEAELAHAHAEKETKE
ncbi:hypothetical protein GOB34_04315 [Sinorhizobium meliloti]|nr:hypothetical protein [Sinorhizobium meliloti]